MKFSINHYYKPTPKKWRKIGDALMGVSTFVTGYAIISSIVWLSITFLVIGALGKFLTNFFSEDTTPQS